ncbi:hypothetical protein M409DRAFT_24645 [Zasmidium cellare ATCC 36951]|uniref:Uncharacterized protein n=1 Tax=Zasmidium cellare ATCC 36951 TaxID=1080233 RepID=A0A6A6CH43_ZASCE|nr:uncharacterized protein M409DRAFT_24645 [Zasmidium cellare ATCC 36951]KAF2165262.1 hypothetical protein M409DRAFT_24645 [Zasmidium cellare ATCC 36951]
MAMIGASERPNASQTFKNAVRTKVMYVNWQQLLTVSRSTRDDSGFRDRRFRYVEYYGYKPAKAEQNDPDGKSPRPWPGEELLRSRHALADSRATNRISKARPQANLHDSKADSQRNRQNSPAQKQSSDASPGSRAQPAQNSSAASAQQQQTPTVAASQQQNNTVVPAPRNENGTTNGAGNTQPAAATTATTQSSNDTDPDDNGVVYEDYGFF